MLPSCLGANSSCCYFIVLAAAVDWLAEMTEAFLSIQQASPWQQQTCSTAACAVSCAALLAQLLCHLINVCSSGVVLPALWWIMFVMECYLYSNLHTTLLVLVAGAAVLQQYYTVWVSPKWYAVRIASVVLVFCTPATKGAVCVLVFS